MVDLLSASCASPGCDTGFDRLVAGFHGAVPVLTQALTDELHVLSRLVEAHAIVGFLSAAYLSPVAQELTSLMEKECEMALRDNTSSSKVKKYSAKSPATVGRWLVCWCFGPHLLPPGPSLMFTHLKCFLFGFLTLLWHTW